MKTKRIALPLLLLALLAAGSAVAQQSQNDDRGVAPGKAYQQGELDTVNLFNGTMNLTIPIGQTYHAGGQLSYGFTLHYATNAWEFASEETTNLNYSPPLVQTRNWSYPARSANAGFGWRLSFGSLAVFNGTPVTYTAPDGSDHLLYPKLHPNDLGEPVYSAPAGTDPEKVYYTTDGTYLRARKRITSGVTTYEIAFPNGIVHTFDAYGYFIRMADANGNWLQVAYSSQDSTEPNPGSTKWLISDVTGRQHVVRFRPGVSYSELTQSATVSHEIVDQIDVAAFGGTRAVYQLEYNSNGSPVTLSRRYVQAASSSLGATVPAYMLTGVVLPGSLGRFSMTYDMGDQSTMSNPATGGASGNALTLTTPTNARFAWTYGVYTFPPADPTGQRHVKEFHAKVSGVRRRLVTDLNSSPNPTLSDTRYEPTLIATIPATEEQVRVDNVDEAGVVVSATRHYFSTCAASCSNPGEYGLPLSRVPASVGGAYLSTEVLVPGTTAGSFTTRRRAYVKYEMDGLASSANADGSQDLNRRVIYTKTINDDDNSSVETTLSDFDGYGHYRTSVTRTIAGSYDETTTAYTNYNSSSGTFSLDSSGNKTGTFSRMTPSSLWILGTFPTARMTVQPAGGSAAYSESAACFDSHGLLTSQRRYTTFNSTTPATTDLLSVFTYNSAGDLVQEQYAGGDYPVLGSHSDAPTAFACGNSLTGEAYAVARDYSYGSLAHSHYLGTSGSMSFQNADNTIDQNTGLVASSKTGATVASNGVSGSDGITTTYTYDALGRPSTITPGSNGGAKTEYTYTLSPPTIDVQSKSSAWPYSTLSRSTSAADALGRATLETRFLPAAASYRKATYDALGRQRSVSEFEATTTPSHFTLFDYDELGRVTKVTRPDGTSTSTVYNGISSVSRTTKVATGTDSSGVPVLTDATTTEYYDAKNRLRRVVEPSSVITDYAYDLANHLTNVCMNVSGSTCGQTRTFTYDNRGFLTSEQQPELGSSGSGTANYQYDARGHVIRRYEGSAAGPFDIFNTYDRAERLTQVRETRFMNSVQRYLKIFEYGTANSGSDLRNGKVTRATRFNWFDSLDYAAQIVEDYTYTGVGGRADSRTTYDYVCAISAGTCNAAGSGAQNHHFTQTFTYDDLGNTSALSYPTCEHTECANASLPQRTLTNTYTNGILTAVAPSSGANSSSITYWANGLVHTVAHGNGVTDTIDIDTTTGMARPSAIHTSAAQNQAACVAPSFTTQPGSTMTTTSASVTLTSAAVGQTGQTITYAWYSSASPSTSIGSSASIIVNPQTTTSYWVVASNSCGNQQSATAVVTICGTPSVTTQPTAATITRSMRATLSAVVSSPAPLNYQWYTVVGSSLSPIASANGTSLIVQPDSTTTYRLRAWNNCGTVDTSNVTVTVQDAPTMGVLLATWNGTAVDLVFPQSAAAGTLASYEYQRLPDGATVSAAVPTGATGTYVHLYATATSGNAYAYRIRAIDSRGVASAWSNYDLASATTFTDDPTATSNPKTPIRGLHIAEVRRAIDAVRALAGLAPAWSSYANATGAIRATDMTDMRTALDEARSFLGFPAVTYSTVLPSTPMPSISHLDIDQLRQGVK